jgi:hypothetical protein
LIQNVSHLTIKLSMLEEKIFSGEVFLGVDGIPDTPSIFVVN